MIKIVYTEEALHLFEEAADKHAKATEQGDYNSANKNYQNNEKVIKFLKEQNEIVQLLKFLKHDSIGVRMWASTHLLPVFEVEGTEALKEIAAGEGWYKYQTVMIISYS